MVAEPECASFEVFHDPEQPGYFRFVENWRRDKEWLVNVSLYLSFFLFFFSGFRFSSLQAEACYEGQRHSVVLVDVHADTTCPGVESIDEGLL